MPKASFIDVCAAIASERAYQEMRKVRDGSTSVNNGHEHEAYLVYMQTYLDEARKVASHTWGPNAAIATMDVLRKVVALGVACMEEHGAPQRQGFEQVPNHDNHDPLTPFYFVPALNDEIPF